MQTLGVIFDVKPYREAKNGRSFLAGIQEVFIAAFSQLQYGDQLALYENGKVNLYNTVGKATAAIANYTPTRFRHFEALNIMNVPEVFLVTDAYDPRLLPLYPDIKHFWSYKEIPPNGRVFTDPSDIKQNWFGGVFSRKVGRLGGNDSDFLPLQV